MIDRDALIEVVRETMWRQTFAPDEDPVVIERQKTNWPYDWDRTLPKAKGVVTALEAAGVRLVPSEATEEMQHAVSVYHIPHSDTYGNYADLDIQSAARDIYVTMIAASPYAPKEG